MFRSITIKQRRSVVVVALLALLAANFPPDVAGDMVLWSSQGQDATPSARPEGELLFPSPNGNYWGRAADSVASGARVTTHARARVQAITFATPVRLYEITLHLEGEGDIEIVRVERAPIERADSIKYKVATLDRSVIPRTETAEKWLRMKFGHEVGQEWRISWPETVKIKNTLLWGSIQGRQSHPADSESRNGATAFETLTGANKTTISDHVYRSWRRPIIADEKIEYKGAVWAQHDKWARLSSAPVLPAPDTLNRPAKLVMARNEYEGALLTLTSLRDAIDKPFRDRRADEPFVPEIQNFTVTLGDVQGPTPEKVKLTLRVAATLRSRIWGAVPGPLFSTENKIGREQMLRYFENGRMIADFPRIRLPPGVSQVFWLEVKTDGAAPGTYRATLKAEPGPSVPIEIEVLPVTLPNPRAWVHVWSPGAIGTSWPFASTDVLKNTVSDKISRGVSCFNGVPIPHSEAAEALRQKKDAYFFYSYLVPKYWVGHGYGGFAQLFENVTPRWKKTITDHVLSIVRQYREAGIDYDAWSGELWYEPDDRSAQLISLAAGWVKDVDPKANVFVNSRYPVKLENFVAMSDVADVFAPGWGNWFRGPEWLKEIRSGRINVVSASQGSNRSEQHEELVGHLRILPWHAFKLGLQGWSFHGYYLPYGDAYSDFEPTHGQADSSAVFPGPRGPVPSRQAEAMRDGWEDYRLLTLLAGSDSPEAKQAIAEATAQIPMDHEPLTEHVDFEAVRLRLLRTAAELTSASGA